MEYPKRLQSNYVNDCNDSKRKRLNVTTADSNNSLTKSIIRFEDLSNDIIYEIFDFLDFRHAYDAFSNLNKRFQNFLTNLTLPVNIDMSSISKSDFQKYYKQIIIPNIHRIKSLHLSNPFSIDIFLTHNCIVSKLIRLETLILYDIQSKDLQNLLIYLISLPYLSSLVISNIDEGGVTNNLYHEIFRLPMLKYCKISFNNYLLMESSLHISINEYSPIEHLIINNDFDIHKLTVLLSYIPQLRRLSLGNLWQCSNEQIISCPIKLNHLTHASLNMNNIIFDQFEILIKHIFFQLQVLYITATNDKTYLDANRWESLILSYMPYLRIFDIQWEYFPQKNVYTADIFMIESFRTQFWLERQWFFTSILESAGDDCYRVLFSTNPYKRKSYTLYGNPSKDMISNYQKNNINSVHYVYIKQEETINDCRNYFPNATELTLSYDDGNPPSIILNHIVPLTQLTKLNINVKSFLFKTMIELLYSTSNIHTLTVEDVCFDKKELASIQQTEIFQLVSTRNKIKNLTINSIYAFEEIKLFIHLCSQLECLRMRPVYDDFEGILRYLLSKNNSNTQCLFYICVTDFSSEEIVTIDTVMESKETIDDYQAKRITQDFYDDIYFWR
ncbi:unnamed protein product [Rotaria sp. Silwood1]|nr:unnamed protein product [Rotaria sp. Silwood1]CAF3760170.1 unnamed protein product [Rotaria sp. Silwood1]CAF4923634.1 unnamed protein product [Rotaria sp. Silwood1]CAF4997517.1 unnamed protein product [Rotaria sp. Silwood1]CAF5093544.1 unnamed protein product [Rotaria sp. Silwood1]